MEYHASNSGLLCPLRHNKGMTKFEPQEDCHEATL